MIGAGGEASTQAGREAHTNASRPMPCPSRYQQQASAGSSISIRGQCTLRAYGGPGEAAGRAQRPEGGVGQASWSTRLSWQLGYLAELLNLSDSRPRTRGLR
jgi:hypothetical protein